MAQEDLDEAEKEFYQRVLTEALLGKHRVPAKKILTIRQAVKMRMRWKPESQERRQL
jgi:hypothetical protein